MTKSSRASEDGSPLLLLARLSLVALALFAAGCSLAMAYRHADWLIFPERHAPPAHQRALEDLRVGTKDMILAVDRMATQQQRGHALEKLHSLIDTIHKLAIS